MKGFHTTDNMVILYCKLHGDFILQPTYGECSEDGYKEMKLGWPHSKQTETPTQMKTNE